MQRRGEKDQITVAVVVVRWSAGGIFFFVTTSLMTHNKAMPDWDSRTALWLDRWINHDSIMDGIWNRSIRSKSFLVKPLLSPQMYTIIGYLYLGNPLTISNLLLWYSNSVIPVLIFTCGCTGGLMVFSETMLRVSNLDSRFVQELFAMYFFTRYMAAF